MARLLLFLVLLSLLIAAGSLYPFTFDWQQFDRPWLPAFLDTWHDPTTRGDVIGNLLLFAPWGFAGLMHGRPGDRKRTLAVGLFVTGVVFAGALQVIQIAVPSRTPSLTDIWLNMAGIGIGLALWLGGSRLPRPKGPAIFPISGLILAGLWLATTAMPLIPSIDWQAWKDSLKPLLLNPEFDAVVFAMGATGWLAVGALLETPQSVRQMPAVLLAGGLVSFGLQVLAVSATVTVSNVAAVLVAAAVWRLLTTLPQDRRRGIAAAALLGAWVLDQLEPFTATAWANPFFIVPFVEYLQGNIQANFSHLLGTVFVFAAFSVLTRENRIPLPVSAIILATIGLLCELAQVYLVGRTPGITNALLPILVAAVIALVPTSDRLRPVGAPALSPELRRPQEPWTRARPRR